MPAPTNEVILQKIQAGKEALRGVNVPATRIVPARGVMNYNRPLAALPEFSGTFSPRRTPVYGRPQIGMTLTQGARYEDFAWFLEHALKGDVAGVSDAGTPPAHTYDFEPTASVDDLKSSTFEAGEPGNVYELSQAMINSFTIRADGDSTDEPAWMLESEWLVRDLVNSSYTGALSAITGEAIMAPGTKVFIDDAAASIGTTQISGKIINFSVTGNNAMHLKGFLEDEGSYGPDKTGRGERVFDAQVTIEFNDDAEFANYRSSTPVERIIRLQREGSLIHGTPDTFQKAELDIAGYWSSVSPGDREGNMIMTFGLMAFVNNTLAYDFAARVVTDLATMV